MNILVIKNISPNLSFNDRDDLFKQFGAQSVTNRPHHSFAVFADEYHSRQAMTRLHQLLIFGRRLRVEFADNPNITCGVSQLPTSNQPHLQKKLDEQNTEAFKEFKIREFLTQIDYVSPNLGLNYLPSPLLKYNYPPATPEIVARIGRTLLYYPRFYTQVLHLMNKMSLPVPFQPLEPSERIEDIKRLISNPSSTTVRNDLSEGESELEDSDSDMKSRVKQTLNNKYIKQKKKSNKKLKTGFVGEKAEYLPQDFELKHKHRDKTESDLPKVFDLSDVSVQKHNIAVNIVSDLKSLNQKSANSSYMLDQTQTSGFGLISGQKQKEPQTSNEIVWDINNLISDEDLTTNRVLESQWSQYSVFKNYTTGEPSVRLYLKNVHKSAEKNDLIRIFGKFIDWDSKDHRNMFDIQLMKSGRMKGQAFVTLPDQSIAQKALHETNGYLFNGKPIVVAFARSKKPHNDLT